jgi:hypothetical protein
MAVDMEAIKNKFQKFRDTDGQGKKKIQYPEDLLAMLGEAKESGISYADLSSASGMSIGGIEKAVRKFRRSGGKTAKKSPKAIKSEKADTVANPKKGGKAGKPKMKHLSQLLKNSKEESVVTKPAMAPTSSQPKKKEVARGRGRPKGTVKSKVVLVSPVKKTTHTDKKVNTINSEALTGMVAEIPVLKAAAKKVISGQVTILLGGREISGTPADIAKILQNL